MTGRFFPFLSFFIFSLSLLQLQFLQPNSHLSHIFTADDAPPRGLSHPCGCDGLDVGSLDIIVDGCVGDAAAPDGEERSGGECGGDGDGDGDDKNSNNNPVRVRVAVVRKLARRGRERGSQGCDPWAHRRHARTRESFTFAVPISRVSIFCWPLCSKPAPPPPPPHPPRPRPPTPVPSPPPILRPPLPSPPPPR